LGGIPDNSAGNFDYGWLGSNERPIEHAGSLATIEMGARQYVPSIGRFLQVDPVERGSANDYDYAGGDPVNGFDLSGMKKRKLTADEVVRAAKILNDCSDPYAPDLFGSSFCRGFRQGVAAGDLTEFGFGFEPDNRRIPGQEYFEACVEGATTGALVGAIGGPESAGAGALQGCAVAVGRDVIKNNTPYGRYADAAYAVYEVYHAAAHLQDAAERLAAGEGFLGR
jgi:RHS repeat-associated protein